MNLLILATLFSMVLAEKSPRLKFTVMGKTIFLRCNSFSLHSVESSGIYSFSVSDVYPY